MCCNSYMNICMPALWENCLNNPSFLVELWMMHFNEYDMTIVACESSYVNCKIILLLFSHCSKILQIYKFKSVLLFFRNCQHFWQMLLLPFKLKLVKLSEDELYYGFIYWYDDSDFCVRRSLTLEPLSLNMISTSIILPNCCKVKETHTHCLLNLLKYAEK